MTVTLQHLKDHLNLTTSDDDTLLAIKLRTSHELVECYTGRQFSQWYDDATEVYSIPAPLIEAVLQIGASLYENSEGAALAPSIYMLMDPYWLWPFPDGLRSDRAHATAPRGRAESRARRRPAGLENLG